MDDVGHTLQALRAHIDALDNQLLSLLNQRAQAAGQVGHLKTGILYRPEREAQILRRLAKTNAGPLPNKTIAFLFREIMSACLAYERPVTVACLGPQGSFSEAAVVRHFGHAAQRCFGDSWQDVFHQTETGQADFALVPVENSNEGSVSLTLDHMLETSLSVCGEVLLRVHHQLLAQSSALPLSSITHVFSHGQSLGQCRHWLDTHLPQAQRVALSSNSEAARHVGVGEPTWVAIAGELAAEPYGLVSLARHIEDAKDNTTRFLVLGSLATQPSGQDKTSLVLGVENRPGAIHHVLAPLAELGVSLTRLESRPDRTRPWSYVFFMDIEGHQRDTLVAQALHRLRERASFVKILGSYPVMMNG